ncbi:hypothetical protein [Methylotenera sp.]|uniref:hypothetical protein n=1 Tax=Methylotenera sp. TaxID=2051956 RepID=UPI002728249C|nr:hypothetical protein [Methylotenera sp.]MDP2159422.1 hypothetical protein [Flavobacterium sp.]MDO9204652.1 hypothetical protein [Methylotenera sp.]MDP1522890.1 hypothetical protein [Methylotenera sp.]MDP2071509.1 hypothetical protein [Methylotenera sp.]MDP3004968.1 hypothetical protein [Methylotenera sp.]
MKIRKILLCSWFLCFFSPNLTYAGGLEGILKGLKELQDSIGSIAPSIKTQTNTQSNNASSNSTLSDFNLDKSTNKTSDKAQTNKVIEVSGVGESLETSKEDAIRQAVQKAVGSYVSSDLITKNDDVIKDKVISLSAAFVEKTEVISQNKREDGLFETKIRATVTSTKLRRALEDQNIATTDLDSESLFGEALTKLDNTNSTLDLWAGMMKKFPQSAVRAVLIGKPKIDPIKDDDVRIAFTTLVGWEPKFRDEFISIMKNTGDISNGEHDALLGLGYTSQDRPVSLKVNDKNLLHQIFQLVRENNKSLSINLDIKNSAGQVVHQVSSCLSKDYYYKKEATNPFIINGSVNVYGFPYKDMRLDFYSSKLDIRQKQYYESRKYWLEAKDSDEFFLHINEVVKRDIIKEFKTVDIVIGDCPHYGS